MYGNVSIKTNEKKSLVENHSEVRKIFSYFINKYNYYLPKTFNIRYLGKVIKFI